MFDTRLPSVDALRCAPVKFKYGNRKMLVDSLTARAILAVYDALEAPENKAKVERMVAGTPEQFHRIAGFAFDKVRIS